MTVIGVADATPVFLRGLTAVLAADGYDLATAGSVAECRELVARQPDLLLADLRLLRSDGGIHAAARGSAMPLVVTVGPADDAVMDLVEDGVAGLWDREGDIGELRRVVAGALVGAPAVSPEAAAGLIARIARASEAARGSAGRLTAREREILQLMADGSGNRAIADALYISENTVRNHVRNVLDKLQARTRTEAVVRAVRSGVIRLG